MNARNGLSAILCVLLAGAVAHAQETRPAKGTLLVASPDLTDPNFARTVVLLLEYDETGAAGLIVNRPTKIKPFDLLPIDGLKEYDGTVYLGGPVAIDGVMVLVRSGIAPEGSEPILGDIYLSNDQKLLEQLAEQEAGTKRFRMYAGYAGWAPGQLDHEIAVGGWRVVPGKPDEVFTEKPSWLWRMLAPGEEGMRAAARLARLVA